MEIKDLSEEVKTWALDYFLGNEVGSDEYRDTQPGNGLNIIADYFSCFAHMTPYQDDPGLSEENLEMLKELRNWIGLIITETEQGRESGEWTAYAGVDALEPLLTRAFNAKWDANYNPAPSYWETPKDILDAFNEDRAFRRALNRD